MITVGGILATEHLIRHIQEKPQMSMEAGIILTEE